MNVLDPIQIPKYNLPLEKNVSCCHNKKQMPLNLKQKKNVALEFYSRIFYNLSRIIFI